MAHFQNRIRLLTKCVYTFSTQYINTSGVHSVSTCDLDDFTFRYRKNVFIFSDTRTLFVSINVNMTKEQDIQESSHFRILPSEMADTSVLLGKFS